MKLVTAIIQPDVLPMVHQALMDAEIGRITVSRCTGHGKQDDINFYRGQEVTPSLIPKIRIDIACNDNSVETAITAIISAARHGEGAVGDGKIFITPLEECIRIRTGEKGETAI